jgi:hypothetical protein
MNRIGQRAPALAVLAAVVLSAGAGAKQEGVRGLPDARRALLIAQSGDTVSLKWKTEKGLYYTLLYTDEQYDERAQGRAVWTVLPEHHRMRGTGQTMERTFQVNPLRPRRFNLRVETEAEVRRDRAKAPDR